MADTLRAAFLLHTSHAPDCVEWADMLDWRATPDEDDEIIQSFTVGHEPVPIAEIPRVVAWQDRAPDYLKKACPRLSDDELLGALDVCCHLMTGLEWRSRLADVEEQAEPEKMAPLLKASLRTLDCFREESRHPQDHSDPS